MPSVLVESLLDYCFQRNLPLLALRMLTGIDGQQMLLEALDRAQDHRWLKVAEAILQQRRSSMPLWCGADTLAFALEEIAKGRLQFKLLLQACLAEIHKEQQDFYNHPAVLSEGGAECPICFEPLWRSSPEAFTQSGRAVCPHFLCSNCMRRCKASASADRTTLKCPECRRSSATGSSMPKICQDPLAWFNLLASPSGTVSRTNLLRGISATLPVDTHDIEDALDKGFLTDEPLSQDVTAAEFLGNGMYAWMWRHDYEIRCWRSKQRTQPTSTDWHHAREQWFHFWNFSASGSLSRGEALRAMLKTFEVATFDHESMGGIRNQLDQLWDRCIALIKYKNGHCNTESLSYSQYNEVGGFGDLLAEAFTGEKLASVQSSSSQFALLCQRPQRSTSSDSNSLSKSNSFADGRGVGSLSNSPRQRELGESSVQASASEGSVSNRARRSTARREAWSENTMATMSGGDVESNILEDACGQTLRPSHVSDSSSLASHVGNSQSLYEPSWASLPDHLRTRSCCTDTSEVGSRHQASEFDFDDVDMGKLTWAIETALGIKPSKTNRTVADTASQKSHGCNRQSSSQPVDDLSSAHGSRRKSGRTIVSL